MEQWSSSEENSTEDVLVHRCPKCGLTSLVSKIYDKAVEAAEEDDIVVNFVKKRKGHNLNKSQG